MSPLEPRAPICEPANRKQKVKRADLVLLHARQLVTCGGPAPKTGAQQSDIRAVEDGALASFEGRVVYAGPSASLPEAIAIDPATRVVNLHGRDTVVPGFVDAHTHAAFAGDRSDELRRRLAGESYEQIAASGGGIVSTVAATRSASESDLIAVTRSRLDEMLACGTTTCEIKSGYGLTLESELKVLRAIKVLSQTHAMSIATTFLGAHDVPLEYRSDRTRYVDMVVDEMIPSVAREGLAEWCDVFCEDGVFTPAESQRILNAGVQAGLKPRIHADELGPNGGSRVAAMVSARSADHLIFVAPDDIRLLAAAEVTATLLPVAAFYLKLGRFAPARALIAAGVPVAIATDVNPGGGLSPSMSFAIALACFGMGMTFEEALIGATLNGAWSLDRADSVGSLEPGKLTDAVIVEGDATNLLRVGAESIRAVIKRGDVVHGTLPEGSDGGQTGVKPRSDPGLTPV